MTGFHVQDGVRGLGLLTRQGDLALADGGPCESCCGQGEPPGETGPCCDSYALNPSQYMPFSLRGNIPITVTPQDPPEEITRRVNIAVGVTGGSSLLAGPGLAPFTSRESSFGLQVGTPLSGLPEGVVVSTTVGARCGGGTFPFDSFFRDPDAPFGAPDRPYLYGTWSVRDQGSVVAARNDVPFLVLRFEESCEDVQGTAATLADFRSSVVPFLQNTPGILNPEEAAYNLVQSDSQHSVAPFRLGLSTVFVGDRFPLLTPTNSVLSDVPPSSDGQSSIFSPSDPGSFSNYVLMGNPGSNGPMTSFGFGLPPGIAAGIRSGEVVPQSGGPLIAQSLGSGSTPLQGMDPALFDTLLSPFDRVLELAWGWRRPGAPAPSSIGELGGVLRLTQESQGATPLSYNGKFKTKIEYEESTWTPFPPGYLFRAEGDVTVEIEYSQFSYQALNFVPPIVPDTFTTVQKCSVLPAARGALDGI